MGTDRLARTCLVAAVSLVLAAAVTATGCSLLPGGGGTTGGSGLTSGSAQTVPAFELDMLGGGKTASSSLLGRPTLLVFSATW